MPNNSLRGTGWNVLRYRFQFYERISQNHSLREALEKYRGQFGGQIGTGIYSVAARAHLYQSVEAAKAALPLDQREAIYNSLKNFSAKAYSPSLK